TEIWGVLDNEMRPGVMITVTISIDPYLPVSFKQVLTREMRFVQDTAIDQPDSPPSTKSPSKTYWVVGGTVNSKKYDASTLSVVLVEKQLPVELDEEGKFSLPSIEEGEYHLDILFNDKVLKRQKFQVPSENYDIEI
ncbi:MAG: hypothetical protein U9O54_05675, partial [Chloroflexota bacterium]|nr:hypothetical protein [Chloroflexota bacterium]